jgi:hypothetical protein
VSARPLLAEAELLVPDDAEHAVDRVRAAMAGMIIAVAEGAVDEASRYVDETATRFAALGQDLGLAYTEMTRGDLALLRGDAQASEPHYRAALELSARHGDETMIGQVLSSLGLISLARGDIAGGRRAILDAATVNRHSGQPSNFASSLEGLAAIALTDDHPTVAARALAAAAVTRRNAASATFPELAPLVEDLATRAREQLGDASYEAAWEEGSHWSAQQALDRTLEGLPDAERPSDSGAGTRGAG